MHDRTPANPSPFFLSMLHGLTWIYGTICSVFSCPELQGVELSNIEPFEHVVTSWRNCEWVVQPFPVNLFDEFVCGLNNMLEDVWPSTHMFVLFASRNEHIFLGFFIIYLYIYINCLHFLLAHIEVCETLRWMVSVFGSNLAMDSQLVFYIRLAMFWPYG